MCEANHLIYLISKKWLEFIDKWSFWWIYFWKITFFFIQKRGCFEVPAVLVNFSISEASKFVNSWMP